MLDRTCIDWITPDVLLNLHENGTSSRHIDPCTTARLLQSPTRSHGAACPCTSMFTHTLRCALSSSDKTLLNCPSELATIRQDVWAAIAHHRCSLLVICRLIHSQGHAHTGPGHQVGSAELRGPVPTELNRLVLLQDADHCRSRMLVA